MSGVPLAALVPILVLLFLLATALWVYQDAKTHWQRGSPVMVSVFGVVVDPPSAWFFCSLFLWVVFFPIYLNSRNRSVG